MLVCDGFGIIFYEYLYLAMQRRIERQKKKPERIFFCDASFVCIQ